MSSINLTELNFDEIKSQLKDFLSNQNELTDYNFEGSTLSVIVDLLTYNTMLNAHKAHVTINECYLESAQLRSNIVAIAKGIGYTPRSSSASVAKINIEVTPLENVNLESSLILPKGSKFKSSINNISYNFTTIDNYEAPLSNDKYLFEDVVLYQGVLKKFSYRVDNNIKNQTFIIDDEDIDTNTLKVYVKDNEKSNTKNNYSNYKTFSNLDSTSQIYYINENNKNKYEIFFGDGVIGKKLNTNNIVEVEYIYTTGSSGNNASIFNLESDIGSNNTISIETVQKSTGGGAREGKESIKRNAPTSFSVQNRAVTAEDYKSLIISSFNNIQTINVWGGQDHEPKTPGKVFICIKPNNSDYLSETEEDFIKDNILKNKTVLEIEQVYIDPDYTYIRVENSFKYNPNITNLSKFDLQNLVIDSVKTYNTEILNDFDGVFRNSNLLRKIEDSDVGILSSINKIYMFK